MYVSAGRKNAGAEIMFSWFTQPKRNRAAAVPFPADRQRPALRGYKHQVQQLKALPPEKIARALRAWMTERSTDDV